MEWRVEFSIEQQNFHLENINKPSPIQAYTNGWFTIYDNLNDVKSCLFCDFVDKKKESKKITKSDIFKYKSEFDSLISVMENVGYSFDKFPSKNEIK